jgi:hypothetical protein
VVCIYCLHHDLYIWSVSILFSTILYSPWGRVDHPLEHVWPNNVTKHFLQPYFLPPLTGCPPPLSIIGQCIRLSIGCRDRTLVVWRTTPWATEGGETQVIGRADLVPSWPVLQTVLIQSSFSP